jgi:hypothetical protein
MIDGGMQPKRAIFALSRACFARGTGTREGIVGNPTPRGHHRLAQFL